MRFDILGNTFINSKNCSTKKYKKINLRDFMINPAWNEFFDKPKIIKIINDIQKSINDMLKNGTEINPNLDYVFNIFNILSPNEIRVVIFGQDPYPGKYKIGDNEYPYATGCSFSTPSDSGVTSSMRNVYKNMIKYGHLQEVPNHGCLGFWILQGCFLLKLRKCCLFDLGKNCV